MPNLSHHKDECGADVAAYALGALEPAEAEAFRRHLQTCIVCRDELASFQQVVDILPMTAPQHKASKALRRRVFAEVNRDAARRQASRRLNARRLLPSFAAARPGLALGVLLAAIVLALGGVELASSGHGGTKTIRAQVVSSYGLAEVRVTDGHAELVVHHFASPPASETYEIWLVRPHRQPQPGGLFGVSSGGNRSVEVRGDLQGVRQLMVTAEPAGGTRLPTHPPILTATLT